MHLFASVELPSSLSDEEQQALVQEMIHSGSSLARAQLIEGNLRLVASIAGSFANTGCDLDDLGSVGCVGLIKAIDTFQPSRGVCLCTYASQCIRNEILLFIRRQKKASNCQHLEDAISCDKNGNARKLMDVLSTGPNPVLAGVEFQDLVDRVLAAVQALPPRQRQVICMHYGLNQKKVRQHEIAARWGISQTSVSRMEHKALCALQRCVLEGVAP